MAALEATDHRGVRRMLFFAVPEPKTVKNRVHVDLATKDPLTEVERLVSLGATQVRHLERNGRAWTVMLDRQGNEFASADTRSLVTTAGRKAICSPAVAIVSRRLGRRPEIGASSRQAPVEINEMVRLAVQV